MHLPIGDYNQDGVVDADDYTTWTQLFGTNNPAADGNDDGVVDAADYASGESMHRLAAEAARAAPSGVPEPATMVLALWLLPAVFATSPLIDRRDRLTHRLV